jgi:phage shock protein E
LSVVEAVLLEREQGEGEEDEADPEAVTRTGPPPVLVKSESMAVAMAEGCDSGDCHHHHEKERVAGDDAEAVVVKDYPQKVDESLAKEATTATFEHHQDSSINWGLTTSILLEDVFHNFTDDNIHHQQSCQCPQTTKHAFGLTSPEAIKIALSRDETHVLDVRTLDEIAAAGRLQHPKWTQIEGTPSECPGLSEVPEKFVHDKDATVVVYCRSGRRAGKAKEVLEGHCYSKVLNAGGYDDVVGLFP